MVHTGLHKTRERMLTAFAAISADSSKGALGSPKVALLLLGEDVPRIWKTAA